MLTKWKKKNGIKDYMLNGYPNNIKQAFASFSRNNILYIHKESIDIDR